VEHGSIEEALSSFGGRFNMPNQFHWIWSAYRTFLNLPDLDFSTLPLQFLPN
jgi:hypothetical protein